jgi:uncharacterized SAM-binding protein YcdF (DUF218 family)
MKEVWSRLKMGSKNEPDQQQLTNWIGEQDRTIRAQENELEDKGKTGPYVDNRPIEPQGKRFTKPTVLKWIIFLVFIIYILVSYYRGPILTSLGKYLVVQHSLEKADLIVCMMGNPVERGLAAADLYEEGMAPRIFVGRKALPDGIEVLKQREVHYPETRDLLIMMLQGLGVPRSDCLVSDSFVDSTFEEASEIRGIAQKEGYRSLIIVTSPHHTRRTWLTFKKVFEKDDMVIMMMPSRYTDFRSDGWWKKGKYVNEVITEYQKLIYYTLKYFL